MNVPRGVTIPANQGRPTNEGPSNTVISAMRCEFVAIEYFDRNGRRHREVVLKAGDDYYSPPNSEAWTEGLKGLQGWLAKGIDQKLPVSSATAARITDNVDILVSSDDSPGQ